jgi:2-polyprenyl-6-methoxyphenol hydroxylase-like FAD-dependent oxidoreductase
LIHYLFDLGGGPAGLSLAIGLKRKGFQNLIVYEREKGEKRIFVRFDNFEFC